VVKTAKLIALVARQAVRRAATITLGLFDPSVDHRCDARLKLEGKILKATLSKGQRN
jgi:hypothetical protein